MPKMRMRYLLLVASLLVTVTLMLVLLLALFVVQASGEGEADLVTNLPGLNFPTNFKTYSGYVNANDNGTWRMHYVLTESQSDPENDPLLLWFSGGPGCSSMAALFQEWGPFWVNHDGETLFENVYAFNKKANVLALESPIGVGFSYDTEMGQNYVVNDDRTAQQNYHAIVDFFNRAQPHYANQTFFIAGDSYAGVYLPMLTKLLIEGINNESFPNPNFQGVAIGNGYLDAQKAQNSLVVMGAYHGRVSPSNWERIKQVCKTGNETDYEKYNYIQFMSTFNGIEYTPDDSECGKLITPLFSNFRYNGDIGEPENYFYNFYQGCYNMDTNEANAQKKRSMGDYQSLNSNTAKLLNYDSTDNQWGFPCWNRKRAQIYVNRQDVQDALHIEPGWAAQDPNGTVWADCNMPLYFVYNNTYSTTRPFFDYIIANVNIPGFRFLIYNGDADPMVNYLGNDWFIKELSDAYGSQEGPREPWLFAHELVGRWQRYTFASLHIDFLTVRGAGHWVPNDRPGPSLQMITNFMFPFANGSDYSSEENIKPQPIISPLVADSPSVESIADELDSLTRNLLDN